MEIYRNHQNVTLFVKENDIFFHIIDRKFERNKQVESFARGGLNFGIGKLS